MDIGPDVKTLDQLFSLAAELLLAQYQSLNIILTRVFTIKGAEILSVDDVMPDDYLYFSAGMCLIITVCSYALFGNQRWETLSPEYYKYDSLTLPLILVYLYSSYFGIIN